MSKQYNDYLEQHIANVVKGYDWLSTNLPHLLVGASNIRKQLLDHDQSKYAPEEYSPYDEYFYGKETPEVVENFQRAWLRHIHHNTHHWQYWVLINDDPGEGEKLIEMPYNYIIEMICDWWAFSWKKGELSEIFSWYDEHASYIKLAPETRKTVEDILWEIRDRLGFNTLAHHGIKGQKWGVKNGPPYPLTEAQKSDLKNANDNHIIKVSKTTLEAEPNSITQVTNRKGGVDRNYYDENGNQAKQISNHDHGQPDRHPFGEHGEHAHDYIYDANGTLVNRPARELTDDERKENSDIL